MSFLDILHSKFCYTETVCPMVQFTIKWIHLENIVAILNVATPFSFNKKSADMARHSGVVVFGVFVSTFFNLFRLLSI